MGFYILAMYAALLVGFILLLIRQIKSLCNKHSISGIKEYMKDDTIKGYHVIFKLVNDNEISFSTTIEQFYSIKEWYEKSNETSYSLKNSCISPDGPISGRYVQLNKVNIVEFSYSCNTNKRDVLNPILYVSTYPVSKMASIFNYIKGLLLAPILLAAYIAYQKYILNVDIGKVLSDTATLNYILNATFALVTIIFVLQYIVSFLFKLSEMSNREKDCIYEVKKQSESKAYTYASLHFAGIACLSYALLSINIL